MLTGAVNNMMSRQKKGMQFSPTRVETRKFDQLMVAILVGDVPTKRGKWNSGFSLREDVQQRNQISTSSELTDGLSRVTGENVPSGEIMVQEKAGAHQIFVDCLVPEQVAGTAANGLVNHVPKGAPASPAQPQEAILSAGVRGGATPEPAFSATAIKPGLNDPGVNQCVLPFDNVFKMDSASSVQQEEAMLQVETRLVSGTFEDGSARGESKQMALISDQPPPNQQSQATNQVGGTGTTPASSVHPEGAMQEAGVGSNRIVERHAFSGRAPAGAATITSNPVEEGSEKATAHLERVLRMPEIAGEQVLGQLDKPANGAAIDQAGSSSEAPASDGVTGSTAAFAATPSQGNVPQPEPVLPGVNLLDFKAQLVQGLKQILNTHKGNRQTEVQLKLQPEHLGRLTIRMFIEQGELSVYFYTGNQQVKEVLEGSLQQLRDSLNQHNLRLDQAFVLTEDGGGDSTDHYCPGEKGRSQWTHGGSQNNAFPGEQLEQVPITAIEKGPGRINYLI